MFRLSKNVRLHIKECWVMKQCHVSVILSFDKECYVSALGAFSRAKNLAHLLAADDAPGAPGADMSPPLLPLARLGSRGVLQDDRCRVWYILITSHDLVTCNISLVLPDTPFFATAPPGGGGGGGG